MGDDAPDYSTISRFRKELAKRGLSEKLFEELGPQLKRHGLMLKEGTLMDATPVAAKVKRPLMSMGAGAKGPHGPRRRLELRWGEAAESLRLQGAHRGG